MKEKISITVDKEIIEKIEKHLKDGKFRNRSHVIEYSIKKFVEESEGEKNETI